MFYTHFEKGSEDFDKPSRTPLIIFLAVSIVIIAGMSLWLARYIANDPSNAPRPPVAHDSFTVLPHITPDFHGRVLQPDGSPAVGATVFIIAPAPPHLSFRNGIVFYPTRQRPQYYVQITTDSDGKYHFPSQTGSFTIGAVAKSGFAELDQDAIATGPDIHLAKWGQIQGRLMIGTKPGINQGIRAVTTQPSDAYGPVHIQTISETQTDADGKFTLDCLAPGEIRIVRIYSQRMGNISMPFGVVSAFTHVYAGDTTTLNLGGIGRPVIGKFIFPPEMNPSDYAFDARAYLVKSKEPVVDYFLQVDDHQNFRIDDVPPGTYTIEIFLRKPPRGGVLESVKPQFTMPPIPAGVSNEPLKIPDIQLQSVSARP